MQWNSWTLSEGQLHADERPAKASVPQADLFHDGIALPLVISKLLLLSLHKLWITLGASEPQGAQIDVMTLAECSIRSYTKDLIVAD
jgi:hypothetical protein